MRKVELLPTRDCEAGYSPVCELREWSCELKSVSMINKFIYEALWQKQAEMGRGQN